MYNFDLSVAITGNIDINMPKTRSEINRLRGICSNLLKEVNATGEIVRGLGQRMQTTANDKAKITFEAASADLDRIAAMMNDLNASAEDLIIKLLRLESMMQ